MARGLISYINHVDRSGAVISTDSEIATLPVANVADPVVQRIWRTAATSAYLLVDFGVVVEVELLGLFGCSLGAADTVRHRLSAVGPGDGELLDVGPVASGVVAGYGQHVYKLAAPVSARYWRCDIAASAAFDIGRAWAGPAWLFERNFSYGGGEDEIDESTVTRAKRSGVAYIDIGPTHRVQDFSLEFMTPADRAKARAMVKAVGRRKQVFYVPDHESADVGMEALLGLLDSYSALTQPHFDVYARALRIIEEK